ncbi:MAG TPA: outer membrane beta-barrel protein [Bradyrhizobium sp.]|uniref:outer membrane beta-barrel protein n=1 Tax=Bradyrhizobium sp. TaxID=376 RepID=UPI002D804BA1|nr:outer membrane beta-barrel protein [Bradyrhizobium sp.]HET7887944.1 outer membrane beta-barrel protein [Bradyrhizobium sp.]
MPRPASGHSKRATLLRAALPCLGVSLALIAVTSPLKAQTLTPDLLRPVRDGFLTPQDSFLRKTSDKGGDTATDPALDPSTEAKRRKTPPAPSRIGAIPRYGLPAANGAAEAGFDSLNRKRKPPKFYPGQVKPKPSSGPGTPAPTDTKGPTNPNARVRISPPPSLSANKAPMSAAVAGTVAGQPARKPLPVDPDPFGAVGDYAGSFLIKSAVELRGGYDTNPGRLAQPIGAPFWVVAPEFLAVSDWERHALVADLRGSFTGYGNSLPVTIDGAASPAPTDINRPDFIGHVDGRLDVTDFTHLTSQVRLRVGTDNPGSPNVAVGLAKYPVFATFGSTVGIDQQFNRLDVAAGATFDRTVYQNSVLTDGTIASNGDRAFNQYGGVGRISYELTPGVKPFVEAEGDSRVHDQYLDNSGFARDSTGGYAKAGTSFEFSRLLTGELAVGWTQRSYVDPRLSKLDGLLTSSSLTWTATPLTTAKFVSTTSIDEIVVPGVSGVLSHTYAFEVDHDFRRWLQAIGKFTYGTYEYQGDGRFDKTYSVEGDVIYKMTRNLWIKGTLRRDILNSNVPLASSASTVVMLGVRVQN